MCTEVYPQIACLKSLKIVSTCLHFQIKSYYVSTIKTISCTEMWPPIYVCNLYKFVPLLPATLFHFPKRFSWNVRMFYRSKQLIEHLNQQFKSLQAHSNRKGQRGGGGVKVYFSVFTCLIRAAGEEQEEKNGPKSDLAFLRYRAPNIEVYM